MSTGTAFKRARARRRPHDWSRIDVPAESRMAILAAVDLFAHCVGVLDTGDGRAPTAAAWDRVPGALIHALRETGLLGAHGPSYYPSVWFAIKLLDAIEFALVRPDDEEVDA